MVREAWTFGGASFVTFGEGALAGVEWRVTRVLRIDERPVVELVLETEASVKPRRRDAILEGPVQALLDAFVPAGYGVHVVHEGSLRVTFHRHVGARDALRELARLCSIEVDAVCEARKIGSIRPRGLARPKPMAPLQRLELARAIQADPSSAGLLGLFNAVISRGDPDAPRAVVAEPPGVVTVTSVDRGAAAGLRARGYVRAGQDFVRQASGAALGRELRWLAKAAFLRRDR